tara:strand:+ start:2109 stop:2297 length:189 start_codon:yes stop_codon:yes gene_type:complete
MTADILTRPEAAAYLGISASYLKQLDLTGHGPCRIKIGRLVRYRRCDLDDWIEARRLIKVEQ